MSPQGGKKADVSNGSNDKAQTATSEKLRNAPTPVSGAGKDKSARECKTDLPFGIDIRSPVFAIGLLIGALLSAAGVMTVSPPCPSAPPPPPGEALKKHAEECASVAELKASTAKVKELTRELKVARESLEKESQAKLDLEADMVHSNWKLAAGDEGRARTSNVKSAVKACAPPASTVPPAEAALAVLRNSALIACDSGKVGPECPSLHDGARTWKYGIRNLRLALEGTTNNMGEYVNQITDDTEKLLNLPPASGQLAELYPVNAANSRQVFEVARQWLNELAPKRTAEPSDVSLPPAVRGLLCTEGAC